MKVSKNVEDSLPIEVLQKGLIITEAEIKKNPILKLTVNKLYNNSILYYFNIYRKQKEIFFQIELLQ